MNEEENLKCPKCGAPVSKPDKFCKNCGMDLTKTVQSVQESVPPEAQPLPSQEPYERESSMLERFYKLVTSPREAMRDIALAPDYGGVFVIIVLQIVLSAVSLTFILGKIELTGNSDVAASVRGIVTGAITVAIVIGGVLFFVFWLVKSLIVKYACDSGSGWNFGVAASVTGYAYLADLVFGIIMTAIFLWFMPSVVIDVSNLDAARQAVADFQAQVNWIRLLFSLPFSFVGLLWKSYLGALGTRSGTQERCSVGTGFAVFFVLGLIGWLISSFI